MVLYKALRSILLADTDNIGAIVIDRIYKTTLPRNPTFPAITMDGVSGKPWSLNTSGTIPLEGTTVQFSCWASLPTRAHSLARMVGECMNGYAGVSEGVTIGAAIVRSSPDAICEYDPDIKTYMVPIDVLIRYSV